MKTPAPPSAVGSGQTGKAALTPTAGSATAASPPTPTPRQAEPSRTPAAPEGPITPEQALENTRRLLDAKHEHDRQPQPWQTLDPTHAHTPQGAPTPSETADGSSTPHAVDNHAPTAAPANVSHARHEQAKRGNR